MHACGHDVHVTMLLGAAKLLQRKNDELKGTVKLVFQPGEEGHAGAYHMLKEGALDKFQAIFGLHVSPELPTGSIGSRPGPILAGSARFVAVIQGKGGHGAMPHETKDSVVTVGFVEAGQAGNVIPGTVIFGGTFRSMTTDGLSYLQQRIREVIEIQAAVHRCTATIDFMEHKLRPYPATVNDEAMYEHVKRVGESLLGEPNVQLIPVTMGAEDFAFYSQKMAAVLFMIGRKNEAMKSTHWLHSPYLVINEEVPPLGAALHAAVAMSYLDRHAAETH